MGRELCPHCGTPGMPCQCPMSDSAVDIGKGLADLWAKGFLKELDRQLEKRKPPCDTCEECQGTGGHYDSEVQDQWYWCPCCDACDEFYKGRRKPLSSVLIFPNGNVAAIGNGKQISALQDKSIIEVLVEYAAKLNYDVEGAVICFGKDTYEVKNGKVVKRGQH